MLVLNLGVFVHMTGIFVKDKDNAVFLNKSNSIHIPTLEEFKLSYPDNRKYIFSNNL